MSAFAKELFKYSVLNDPRRARGLKFMFANDGSKLQEVGDDGCVVDQV